MTAGFISNAELLKLRKELGEDWWASYQSELTTLDDLRRAFDTCACVGAPMTPEEMRARVDVLLASVPKDFKPQGSYPVLSVATLAALSRYEHDA